MIILSAEGIREQLNGRAGVTIGTGELNLNQLMEMESWSANELLIYDERAGPLEFDGGVDREHAEWYAYAELFKQIHGAASVHWRLSSSCECLAILLFGLLDFPFHEIHQRGLLGDVGFQFCDVEAFGAGLLGCLDYFG